MRARMPKGPTTTSHRGAWLLGLWFAVGLQPCAVAALSTLECPHCPSELHAEDADAAAHAHHGDGHAHGSHGTAQQAEPDCQAEASDCCELGDAAFDGRNPGSSLKDSSDAGDAFAAAPIPYLSHAPADEARPDPPDRQSRPLCGRRLHAIYCVYLD